MRRPMFEPISRQIFDFVCAEYRLSPESKAMAWEALRTDKAAECYRSIVRSYGAAPGEILRDYQ